MKRTSKRKMSIREAFSKMKKMFPGEHVTAEVDYTRYGSGKEERFYQLYHNKGEAHWIVGCHSFEEAFERLNARLKGLL